MTEDWRPIPGWEDFYEASTAGRIRRIRSGYYYHRILQAKLHCKKGRNEKYRRVRLYLDGRIIYVFVSSLIARTFLPDFDDNLQVDHINGIHDDDRSDNLRMATNLQNAKNRPIYRSNSVGFKGVTFNKKIQKYLARITVDKKRIQLGYFDCPAEAGEVYNQAAVKHFGEFARTACPPEVT